MLENETYGSNTLYKIMDVQGIIMVLLTLPACILVLLQNERILFLEKNYSIIYKGKEPFKCIKQLSQIPCLVFGSPPYIFISYQFLTNRCNCYKY